MRGNPWRGHKRIAPHSGSQPPSVIPCQTLPKLAQPWHRPLGYAPLSPDREPLLRGWVRPRLTIHTAHIAPSIFPSPTAFLPPVTLAVSPPNINRQGQRQVRQGAIDPGQTGRLFVHECLDAVMQGYQGARVSGCHTWREFNDSNNDHLSMISVSTARKHSI